MEHDPNESTINQHSSSDEENSTSSSDQTRHWGIVLSEGVEELVIRTTGLISRLYSEENRLYDRPSKYSLQNANLTLVEDELNWQVSYLQDYRTEFYSAILECLSDGEHILMNHARLTKHEYEVIQIDLDILDEINTVLKKFMRNRLSDLRGIIIDRQQAHSTNNFLQNSNLFPQVPNNTNFISIQADHQRPSTISLSSSSTSASR